MPFFTMNLQPRKRIRGGTIRHVDLIVVGAGLAGTAMAWAAHWRGWSVAILDRNDPSSSSRVAAGLVTPITGSRAAASWRWSDFYPVANDFYRRVEATTGVPMWNVEPALRVFKNEEENRVFYNKWVHSAPKTDRDSIHAETSSDVEIKGLRIPFGTCRMSPSARLLTVDYLDESRRFFDRLGAYYRHDLNCDNELEFHSPLADRPVGVPCLALTGRRIVFCQGFAANENHFFSDLPLFPARGDIVTIRSPKVLFHQVIHRDSWAVPLGEHRYLVGATYGRVPFRAGQQHTDMARLDSETAAFRNELMLRWESIAEGTFAEEEHFVLEHRWAIRPASYDRHPLIGRHDTIQSAYCFNGLGSKGTLMSPRLATLLLESMEGATIDPAFLRSRRK